MSTIYDLNFTPQKSRKKASVVGILSLIAVGIMLLLSFISVVLGYIIMMNSNMPSDESETLIGVVAIILFFINFIGLILGIVGLTERGKSKLLPILGISLNGIFVVTFILLISLGILIEMGVIPE